MSKPIKIYTTNYCPYCVRAKTYFKNKNLSYEEIDLTGNFDEINRIKKETGHMTVPLIFVGDQFIGGYTDMMDKINSGELKF